MTKALTRCSLLLFLVSFVGLLGLSGGINPLGVARIQAHAIVIDLTSNGGSILSFDLNAHCSTSAMAPGDVCTATAEVGNTGEGDYTLSVPVLESMTGTLTTCGEGGWFETEITNLSYVPDTEVIDVGGSATFDVIMSLNVDAPNPCQAQSAHIVISISALATEIEDDSTPTPGPISTPVINQPTSVPTSTSGVVIQQTPVPSPTFFNETLPATPTIVSVVTVATPGLFNEVIPQRFPVTGQGSLPTEFARTAQGVFIGVGLIGAGVLLLAIFLVVRTRRDQA
jgi:hypothetical protein